MTICAGLALMACACAALVAPSAAPDHEPMGHVAANVPSAAALSVRQAAREMMRAVHRQSAVCAEGCRHSGDGAIACAMFAPGHRPRRNGEDTPNIGNVDEFTVQNPSWKWPQPGGLGTPVAVTYSFSNLLNGGMSGISAVQLENAVEEALDVWAAQAPLIFTKVLDAGALPTAADTPYAAAGTPNLRFGHHTFDGPSGVLAHAYYPSSTTQGLSGDLHFDSGETWGTSPGPGRFDFLEVCVHELGHALGLGHEDPPPTAIMNPFYGSRYTGMGSAFLFQDDIDGIKSLYVTGSPPTSGCLLEQLVNKTKQSVLKNVPTRLFSVVDDPAPLFKDLRWFRDTVLNRTDIGRKLASTYYKHGTEVFTAIAEHPALAGEALAIAAELRPCLVRQGKAQANVALPRTTYERSLAWLDRVEPLVSDDAREAIVQARRSLAGITHESGRTVTIQFEDAAP